MKHPIMIKIDQLKENAILCSMFLWARKMHQRATTHQLQNFYEDLQHVIAKAWQITHPAAHYLGDFVDLIPLYRQNWRLN